MVTLGARVRKAPKLGYATGGVLGQVVELVTKDGKEWARVASGKAQLVSSLWPVRQLEVVV